MANKRILVIGGTGYIGRNLTPKLVTKGYEVTLLLKDEKSLRKINCKCNYIICNLLDRQHLIDKIPTNFDIVIDLAAVTKTLCKRKYEENVIGLTNLLYMLEKKNIKKIVYFSTQNVNLKNKGPYALSKIKCEKLIKMSKLDYIIIRPNYVYGCDKENYFYKMAKFICWAHIAPIVGDGNYKIQPTSTNDLCNVILRIIRRFKSKVILNVSGRETMSINEIINSIGEYLHIKPSIINIPLYLLNFFKIFIPFDIEGFTEDRIVIHPFDNNDFSLFSEDLKK